MRVEMLTLGLLFHKLREQRRFLTAYLALTGLLNLFWEILQLPLYTLWEDGTPSTIAFAVVHCTLGDVLIAFFALLAALILSGTTDWPHTRYWKIALVAEVFGITYTVFSEWNNTVITRSWEYSSLMPTISGVGLSPIAQWFLIPSAIFLYLQRTMDAGKARF